MSTIPTVTSAQIDYANQLIPLLRGDPAQIRTFLHTVEVDRAIPGTSTHAHCYILTLDGNKRPRVSDFARFLASKIVDFAIPRSEIERAKAEAIRINSTSPIIDLNNRARALFTKLPQSGEGGEVLLSLMVEAFKGLPQLFTKMILKTSTDMHVHGADGIHGGVTAAGGLALYWGESKLHADVTAAVRECFESLEPFLNNQGGSTAAQERDLQLIRTNIDLNNQSLEAALKTYLDPTNVLFNNLEYRGVCLVGFDTDKYPQNANSTELATLATEIKEVFDARIDHIQKRLLEEGIESFIIELFLLPFPDIEQFRTAFRKELGFPDA